MTSPVVTYFVLNPESGRLKIGRTTNLADRIRRIETSVGHQMELLAAVNGDHEGAWHKRFSDSRRMGEWFEVTPACALALREELGVAITVRRRGGRKLSDAQVVEIRARYATGSLSHRALGKMYGVSGVEIHRLVTFKRRTLAAIPLPEIEPGQCANGHGPENRDRNGRCRACRASYRDRRWTRHRSRSAEDAERADSGSLPRKPALTTSSTGGTNG
jgi:hypothetical protein